MTTTIDPTETNGRTAAPSLDLDGPGSSVKKSRVPELALGALVLVVSALAALWLFTTSSDRTEVLALANQIERGQVLSLEDLVTVEIAADEVLVVLRPDQAGAMVGRVALTDLPAGVLAVPSQFAEASPLDAGEGLVGLDLTSGQVPSSRLAPGTTVSVMLTPAPGGEDAATADGISELGDVLVETAIVVESIPTGGQGGVYVALSMSESDARAVSMAASLNRVRLVQVKR